MKWLLIQSALAGKANEDYRECFGVKRALETLGDSVEVWGYDQPNFSNAPDFNSYDVIFTLENYGDFWLPNLAEYTAPYKVFWSVDAHVRGAEPFEKLCEDHKYNLLMFATRDFVKDSHHFWFPNALDEFNIHKVDVPKDIILGFCGSMLNNNHPRNQVVNYLEQHAGLVKEFRIGDDMVAAINSYHIHFNMNIANDINFRSFETLGCGTALLSNYNPQYNDLGFIDGENYISYSNLDELWEKLKYYINSLDEVARIAESGFKFVLDGHTYTHRMKDLRNYIKEQA